VRGLHPPPAHNFCPWKIPPVTSYLILRLANCYENIGVRLRTRLRSRRVCHEERERNCYDNIAIFYSKCIKKRLAIGLRPVHRRAYSAPPEPLKFKELLRGRTGQWRKCIEERKAERQEGSSHHPPATNSFIHYFSSCLSYMHKTGNFK